MAVVVNADSDTSKTVAYEYIHLRKIPAANVVHLTGLDSVHEMHVGAFPERILLPVMTSLYNRGVLEQIDCIAYSADIPVIMDVTEDLASAGAEPRLPAVASINGLTYLYQAVLAKQPKYLQAGINYYRRRPTRSLSARPLGPVQRQKYPKSLELIKSQQWKATGEILQPLAKQLKSHAAVHYELACTLARLSRTQAALQALTDAVHAGWSDRKKSETDPDLDALRECSRFETLLDQMDKNRRKPFHVQPTTAFSAQYQWNARGERVNDRGMRYLLSMVLAVTGESGVSVGEAVHMLHRSAAAGATHPQGTVYFVSAINHNTDASHSAFVSAIQSLRKTEREGCVLWGWFGERIGRRRWFDLDRKRVQMGM